jgi:hypothetical protein
MSTANFFDSFEEVLENEWAYRFQRAFDEKPKAAMTYISKSATRKSNERRKGPTSRRYLTWFGDMADEDRFDETGARKRNALQGIAIADSRLTAAPKTNKEGRPPMRKKKPTMSAPNQFVPGRLYRGLRGKVVDWVEHKFEEGLLYIHVRFIDKTELCWRIAPRMTIEEGHLSDWKSGDFKQLRVFVRNQRDRIV